MSKYLYAFAAVIVFAGGAYVWKVKNTGFVQSAKDAPTEVDAALHPPSGVVVEIAGDKVTQDDIDWEYQLATAEVRRHDELTAIPDLGSRFEAELQPLRKALIASVIERKLLYKFIQRDKEFNVEDPGRYERCMSDLQDAVSADPKLAATRDAKARLRSRLCERSILDQYMRVRLFASLSVNDREVVEYYKNHVGEFKRPDRVEIRQILLPDEATAKRVRGQLSAQNFADLARDKSIAPEAVDGGRLGPFSKATLPAIYEVAWHLGKHQISDIIKSPYGYHIIMLLDKHPKQELSLDEARPKISATLRRKKEEERYRAWVETALAAITVSTPKPLW